VLNVVLPTGLSSPRAYFNLDWITLVVMFIVRRAHGALTPVSLKIIRKSSGDQELRLMVFSAAVQVRSRFSRYSK
jgi:hypothetical protein